MKRCRICGESIHLKDDYMQAVADRSIVIHLECFKFTSPISLMKLTGITGYTFENDSKLD